jgi:dedicator of cytokinesis protein 3
VSIKVFHGDKVDEVIQTHSTDLYAVPRTNRIGFNDAPNQSRSDMFITLSKIANAHGLLKSFTGHGHVNVTAQIRLRDHPETVIEDAIYRGTSIQSNGETTYESYLVATGNEIGWDEKFKICISEDIAPRALLVFKFNLIRNDAELSEPEVPIGVAALVLSTKGLFASDGEHRMKIRKLEHSESFEAQFMAYLHDEIQSPLSSDPILTVESFLCSTRFTEDNTLHSLLHWKSEIGALTTDRSRFQLKDILRKFTFVSEIEILKVPIWLTSLMRSSFQKSLMRYFRFLSNPVREVS